MKWRWVVGYKGWYKVSDSGKVKNRRGQILRQSMSCKYPAVTLKKSRHRVHKLVLEAFAGPCPKGMQARHLNDIKTDNRWPENLAWGTPSHNMTDAHRHGLRNNVRYRKGESHGRSKLTEKQVLQARRIYNKAKKKYGIVTRLAKKFGVTRESMREAVMGKTWRYLPLG